MIDAVGAWVAFIPAVLVTALLLVVPGLVLGLALRLRGWWLAGSAAPLSVSLITVGSILAGWAGVRWSVIPVIGLTLIAVAAALAWRRWAGARPVLSRVHSSVSARWAGILAVVIPLLVIAFVIARGMGEPDLIAQRYDNFFHLNAIQYVLDTGNASPFWVGSMTAPGNLLFYPSGWHAVGSLIAQLSGCSVPAASNALVLVLAAGVWPVSAILLARVLFGANSIVTVATGVLAAATPAFPYLPLHYGPLYPYFLGLALVPVGIAVLITALRPHLQPRRQDRILLFVLLVPGIAIAHPAALLALLVLGVPSFLVLGWWLWRRFRSPRSRLAIAAGGVGFVLLGVAILKFVRPPESQIYWPVIESLPAAIGEVVSAAVYGYPVAWVFAALAFIGAACAAMRPTFGRSIALGMALVGVILYVVVAGSPYETLRTWLSGPWYNNAPRLASIWALAVVPLAASGALFVVRWVLRRVRRVRPIRVLRGIPALVVFAVLVVVLTQTAPIRQAAADIEFVYGGDDAGPILSKGEYALLLELDELVPKDAVIAGDPWTGTSFAYALSGRRVLMPHLLMDETDPAEVINSEFASDGDAPEVCDALRETGVRYVLEFDGGAFMEDPGGFEGVAELERSPFVKLVAEEPGARLYQVTSCGLVK